VPQRADKHPEVDTGLHSLLTLEQAARLSPDVVIRFAALVHDLGKGLAPRAEWPTHKGHEERGEPLVDEFCRRHGAPEPFRELGRLAARWHGHANKAAELRPGTLLGLLEAWDALDRPERLEALILVGMADKRGRTGHEADPYPQGDILRRARDAAAAVAAAPGLPADRLRQRRIAAIARALRAEAPATDCAPRPRTP
jgi:tRNA nucleotidyltransferase (CCA-adding enzyme)